MFRQTALLLCFFALTPVARADSASSTAAEQDQWTGVARVVAVGDIHGDYEKFLAVLRLAGLIDERGDWSGGKAHLVQTGDVPDRGADSRKVMDHLMRLEKQARAAGGRVHALIGNHEALNMTGDFRYVSDGEFAAFGDPPRGSPLPRPPIGDHPNLRAAFSPQGVYGKWILGHNAIILIDGTLFMHGGLSPKYKDRDLHDLNRTIRQELAGEKDFRTGIVGDDQGPLWYRGWAESAQEPMQETQKTQLEQVLSAQKARRMVIGHTVQDHGIVLRYDDRLALIDVGMSSRMLDAPPTCLLIERGRGRGARTAVAGANATTEKISILK